MELLEQKYRVGNQKGLHLRPPPIEHAGAPSFMLLLIPSLVLITGRPVKLVQPVFIFRKMRRNPIEDHADAVFMAFVYIKSFGVPKRDVML